MIGKDTLGHLTDTLNDPHMRRTLEKQNIWSHTKAGGFCDCCKAKVTDAMVKAVAGWSDAQHKAHRDSHFGTVAGRRAIWQLPWDRIQLCLLHLKLRTYATNPWI